MKKFTKGLLNYFAAYSETRFQFSAKVGYKWSDDHLSADFSVFPDFQKLLLDIIKQTNKLRNTPGARFWQRNYYEHVIRNDADLNRIRQYIIENPLKWDADSENPDNIKKDCKNEKREKQSCSQQ